MTQCPGFESVGMILVNVGRLGGRLFVIHKDIVDLRLQMGSTGFEDLLDNLVCFGGNGIVMLHGA
jgi:hypothetical protein